MELKQSERSLLRWLGEEDYSQYGECCGRDLDALIEKGLAKIHSGREGQGSFIANGDGPLYKAVSLTEAGREFVSQMPQPN